jgi:toxin ParE1/3/4
LTPRYVLTRAAEGDLREVIGYTRRQWGEAQVRRYVGQLQRCAEALAAGDGAYRDLDDVHPGLRVRRCQHHYIFCLPRPDAPALIVAILHELMDLMARIAGRLG